MTNVADFRPAPNCSGARDYTNEIPWAFLSAMGTPLTILLALVAMVGASASKVEPKVCASATFKD